jgi:uncharacterized protein (TIGR03066 family)
MKTVCAVVVVACVGLCLSGCGSGPESLILGKWETGQAGAKMMVEFDKGGKTNITMMGKTLEGTYKVNGADELEWTVGGKTTKCKVKVTATELELTSEGNTIVYKKV